MFRVSQVDERSRTVITINGQAGPPLLARCVHNRPRRLGLESDGIRRASHGSEVARKWAR
jgi:hypothetical protein